MSTPPSTITSERLDQESPAFDSDFRSELHALLAWRRDVRRFRSDPLPDGALERWLDLACAAPSVGLSQPWRFVRVEESGRREKIADSFRASNAAALAGHAGDAAAQYASLKLAGLAEAPCHLAVFADHGTAQGRGLGRRTMPETIDYSVVAAIHTLWLVTRAEGVGMGWVSILDPQLPAAILDVPQDWRFIAYLCLGYPLVADPVPELERAGWEHRRNPADFLVQR